MNQPRVSVIVPTFNEESVILSTLDTLTHLINIAEIIVADGGSTDQTVALVHQNFPVIKLVETKIANRGLQMDAGAELATGSIFWFIHADTVPSEKCVEQIIAALEDRQIVGGNCRIKFDGGGLWARILSWLYPRLRRLNLIYGDSAIFVRREIFERVNGFGDLPLFEDVDFYRRAQRLGQFAYLHTPVVTSSRRFQSSSFIVTFAKWAIFQGLYWLGFSPHRLAKWYKVIR